MLPPLQIPPLTAKRRLPKRFRFSFIKLTNTHALEGESKS
jgi:hypothetical protein